MFWCDWLDFSITARILEIWESGTLKVLFAFGIPSGRFPFSSFDVCVVGVRHHRSSALFCQTLTVTVTVTQTRDWAVRTMSTRIKLDVGGVKYTTSLTTLTRFPVSMIGCMFSGRHALQLEEDGCFFIDRDGTHSRHILNFMRSPEGYKVLVIGAEKEELRRECEYYGSDQLIFPTSTPVWMNRGFCDVRPYTKGKIGKITVRVDAAGVQTIFHTGEPIKHCPHCYSVILKIGGQERYFPSIKCTAKIVAAQPQVVGRCSLCLYSHR
jgi:hypothetical protein